MRYLILLLLVAPAWAQAPSMWEFEPICQGGKLRGLVIGAREPGVIAVKFDAEDLCSGHI